MKQIKSKKSEIEILGLCLEFGFVALFCEAWQYRIRVGVLSTIDLQTGLYIYTVLFGRLERRYCQHAEITFSYTETKVCEL